MTAMIMVYTTQQCLSSNSDSEMGDSVAVGDFNGDGIDVISSNGLGLMREMKE